MKIKIALLFAALAHAASAAPLTGTAAVHTRSDAASPIIGTLKAGTEPVVAPSAPSKAGWTAVEMPGPFEGYVQNKDLAKSLDVKPGSSIHLAPNADAGVLAVSQKGDKTTITGLHGKWTQVSLEKKLTGYILTPMALGNSINSTPTAASAPAPAAPFAPAPVAPAAYGTTTAGQAAPIVNLGDSSSSSLPRQFAGKFVSTRRALAPRRPYDWALNDDAGKRYAYLDVSKLLLTEQIEKYVDHAVVVYGAAKNAPGGKDLLIEVESLQLR